MYYYLKDLTLDQVQELNTRVKESSYNWLPLVDFALTENDVEDISSDLLQLYFTVCDYTLRDTDRCGVDPELVGQMYLLRRLIEVFSAMTNKSGKGYTANISLTVESVENEH